MDIKYCKIRVPGHQDVPDKCCQKFFRVVSSFLQDNRQNGEWLIFKELSHFLFVDTLIGIHCTHGINRSGYFIVRY
jgi:protein-tyrosine phosphatase